MTQLPQTPEPPDPTEQSLELGLRREPLSEEARARIRSKVEAEWRATLPPKTPWWRHHGLGLAASLAATAILTAIWFQPAASAPVFGTVARADTGVLLSGSTPFAHRALAAGAALRTDQTFTAQGSTLVALSGGGTLRVARGSVIETHSLNEIELREGSIYVDLPPHLTRHVPFVVRTALGSVEHVGTQFEVSTVDQSVHVRVREGKVRLRRGAGSEIAVAGTEIIVPPTGRVIHQPVATSGRDWSWVDALAPDYDIESRPLMDFLQWASRETGRRLDVSDPRARDLAERTQLHGTIHGLTPLEAVGRVINTTSLKFDLHEDAIHVSSDE